MAYQHVEQLCPVTANGRPANYREFLSRFLEDIRKPITLYARRRLRNTEYADDVFAEVSYRVIRDADDNQIRTYELPPLRKWVYRIASNYCADMNRLQFERRRVEISDLLVSFQDTEQEIIRQQSVRAIIQAIIDLPEANRKAVWLCRVVGMVPKEAAEVLGISVGAFKSRLHRGVNMIKLQLENDNGMISYQRPADQKPPLTETGFEELETISALPDKVVQPALGLVRSTSFVLRRGRRRDSPDWFHHPLTPVRSIGALAKAVAANNPDRSVDAIGVNLRGAFLGDCKRKLGPALRKVTVSTVRQLCIENGLDENEQETVINGFLADTLPNQL